MFHYKEKIKLKMVFPIHTLFVQSFISFIQAWKSIIFCHTQSSLISIPKLMDICNIIAVFKTGDFKLSE